jgi:hypothetical protein
LQVLLADDHGQCAGDDHGILTESTGANVTITPASWAFVFGARV